MNSQQIESMTSIKQKDFGGAVSKMNGTNIILKYEPSDKFNGLLGSKSAK